VSKPSIPHIQQERKRTTSPSPYWLVIFEANRNSGWTRIAKTVFALPPQMGRCRQNIESNVARTKITPGGNEHFMRKKVLDITL
jgi:hypothetical protein